MSPAKLLPPSDFPDFDADLARSYRDPFTGFKVVGAPVGSVSVKLENFTRCELKFIGSYCGSLSSFAPMGILAGGKFCKFEGEEEDMDVPARYFSTFFGLKSSAVSPLPATGVSVWRMTFEDHVHCHVYLAWRVTSGAVGFGPNVVSVGMVQGAPKSLPIDATLLANLLANPAATFFRRIPQHGTSSTPIGTGSFSTGRFKVSAVLSQKCVEDIEGFRTRCLVKVEQVWGPGRGLEMERCAIYLVARVEAREMIEREDRAADDFGVSFAVATESKTGQKGVCKYKIVHAVLDRPWFHPRVPCWPVLNGSTKEFCPEEEAKKCKGKIRYLKLCTRVMDPFYLDFLLPENPSAQKRYQPGVTDSAIWTRHLLEMIGMQESVAREEIQKMANFMRREYQLGIINTRA